MGNERAVTRMKELIEILNDAGRAYYGEGREIMSNLAYDKLYDELLKLEQESGTVLSGSPTQQVGYQVLSELPKERHASPMLSLDKTKSAATLAEWLGDRKGLLSWKLDGLTVVLHYEGGLLVKAVTRGNGEIGEVVTQNAKAFENVPLKIPFQGNLVLRGEAVISYADFERINEEIPEADAKYKNPRNLCAGSVRQLDAAVTRQRHVKFIAFALVSAEQTNGSPYDFKNARSEQFAFLQEQGFEVVEYRFVTADNVEKTVAWFSQVIGDNAYPSDGLVLTYEDIAYGEALGKTAKFPRNSIAFKWSDELAETVLREIEWSPSRTGLINPVAIFDPVELEGTTVSRASLHNLSIIESLRLGIGDRIMVYKANMIIPQLAENLTGSDTLVPVSHCPSCGADTEVRQDKDAKYLVCPNQTCPAKRLKNFVLFVSRDALNIDGLSEVTLEKFIAQGLIHSYADIFRLERDREEITRMEGFGEKSYENLVQAVQQASETDLYRVIYGLGIAGIGLQSAKQLCRHFHNDLERIESADAAALLEVDGIGGVLAANIEAYFADEQMRAQLDELMGFLTIRPSEQASVEGQPLAGMRFVITGSLNHFANRKELEQLIEGAGGKCTAAVSSNTSYLINNDMASNSGKNKKAKSLGIPILSEEQFLQVLQGERTGGAADEL